MHGDWKNISDTLAISSLGYVRVGHPRLGQLPPFKPHCSGKDRAKFMHKGKTYFLAREVCRLFHGAPPSPKHTVDHINRDPHDDRADNLRWASPREQTQNRAFTTDRRKGDVVQSDLPGEVWVQLGNRRISNMGRFQSKNPASKTKWNPITTPRPCRGQKYATIKNESFHRLVALTFLPPPGKGDDTVDHINQDVTDNRVANLRWANRSLQNSNRKRKATSQCLSIEIEAYDSVADRWERFRSTAEAARQLGEKYKMRFHPFAVASAAKRKGTCGGIEMRLA